MKAKPSMNSKQRVLAAMNHIKPDRIPEVSKSEDYHNVIENLKRMHDLPRIHICGKPLYPLEEIREWIKKKTTTGK